MNLLRFIIIAVTVWLLVIVIRQYLRRSRSLRAPKARGRIGTMVRCQRCGLHIPETEALKSGEYNYCSLEHRDQS